MVLGISLPFPKDVDFPQPGEDVALIIERRDNRYGI